MRAKSARLVEFKLLAYRSCKDAKFQPTANVTAVIGPNGAGKTNLMQGIRLLSLPIRPYRFQNDEELYASSCSVKANFSVGKKLVRYTASVTYRQNETGRDEVITLDQKWNFSNFSESKVWIKDDDLHFPSAHQLVRIDPSTNRYIMRYVSERRKKPFPDEILQAYNAVEKLRRGIRYYSASQFTNPSLSPTSFDVDEDGDLISESLIRRRLPHTNFIYELYRLQQVNQKTYDTFLSLVDARGVGLIDKLKWSEHKFSNPTYEVRAGGKVVTQKKDRILVIPTVHVGEAQLSFNQLSEGTLRTLAMIFYIVTDKSELLLMEEPEVCVHHGLLKSVIEIIKEYSKRKQIIVSTHSEAVIDNLEPEQVMIVERSLEKGTVVNPISKVLSRDGYKALKAYLSSAGTLGEYWRHSGF